MERFKAVFSPSAENQVKGILGQDAGCRLANAGSSSGDKGCSFVHSLLEEKVQRHCIHGNTLKRLSKLIRAVTEHIQYATRVAYFRREFKEGVIKIKAETCLKAEVESFKFDGLG